MVARTLRNLEHEKLKDAFCSVSNDDPGYLDHISSQVVKYRHTKVPLPNPQKYDLRIGGLSDTVYSGNEEELEAWKDFYLPESTEMEVIGTIDHFPSLAVGLQLIILAGEDGKVYAYENEVLHLVAESLNDLFDSGAVFPGIRSYNLGECFEEPTEEELEEIMQDDGIKEIKAKTKEILKSTEAEFLEILDLIESKRVSKAVVPYQSNKSSITLCNVLTGEYLVDSTQMKCKIQDEDIKRNEKNVSGILDIRPNMFHEVLDILNHDEIKRVSTAVVPYQSNKSSITLCNASTLVYFMDLGEDDLKERSKRDVIKKIIQILYPELKTLYHIERKTHPLEKFPSGVLAVLCFLYRRVGFKPPVAIHYT